MLSFNCNSSNTQDSSLLHLHLFVIRRRVQPNPRLGLNINDIFTQKMAISIKFNFIFSFHRVLGFFASIRNKVI